MTRRVFAILLAGLPAVASSPAEAVAPPSWFAVPAPMPIAAPPAPPAPRTGLETGAGEAFEVVPLKYADVSEVVGLLTGDPTIKPNDSFTPQEPNFGSAAVEGYYGGGVPPLPFGAPSSAPNPQTETLGQAVDGVIGVDRRLNAIVLKGPPERLTELKAQIAKLDVPVTSVVLETVFVELTETGARNLGLDLNNANNQIATAAYSFSTNGFPGLAATPAGGAVAVNLQAALYAQIAKGNGRIVSKPRIAAQSGSSAKIVTGDALPILTSIAISGVNAVQQQVQYVNVGVTLQIAPRVTDDGFVTSHVFAVVSSVTGFSQGYPTISQREASTSATVRDGDSFVIGGLTQESNLSRHSRLPGLGDAPLIGKLFDTENTSRAKTDLYIFVTPHIVRPRGAASPPPQP
ncbi:MAG TPA: secretin N-terminal domain-containing protein [Caulobacteraceae bacterium]|nr:secretin N-terminal domain-containing protein [Caulobacteraceae bacterium]